MCRNGDDGGENVDSAGESGEYPRIGVSACLLGERVRYDGTEKGDPWIRDVLGRFVTYVPVCPEVEAGFPVPREPIRLEGDPAAPRLVSVETRVDHTARLARWMEGRIRTLERARLCGFIFKSRSPSCGLRRVEVHRERGRPLRRGRGLFARAVTERFPALPAVEEGDLAERAGRDHFVERFCTTERWNRFLRQRQSLAALRDFHKWERLLLLAHEPRGLAALDRLLEQAEKYSLAELYQAYGLGHAACMARPATKAREVSVFRRVMNLLKGRVPENEMDFLQDTLERYRTRPDFARFIAVEMMRRAAEEHFVPDVLGQACLNYHSVQLLLEITECAIEDEGIEDGATEDGDVD